jgi:hypothetical protein
MKIACKENHWKIDGSKLILDTPEGQEAVAKMTMAIQARVRLEIYEQICALDLTTRLEADCEERARELIIAGAGFMRGRLL